MMDVSRATAPENNVVVQAAAGTGKTWLLTSRIIRLLLQGTEPGAILALSFTRKAAGEIHERVTERLLALAASDEDALVKQLEEIGAGTDPASREAARGLYEKHLSAIHPLRTTTFHAFCQEILRRFPLEADVPPGFELVESTAELEQAAWLALDRKAARDSGGTLANALDTLLRECGGVTGTHSALDDFLAHRSDWWAYTENESNPVDFAATQLGQMLDVAEDADPHASFMRDPAVREHIARYAELLAGHPTATNQEYIANLTRALADTQASSRSFEWVRGVVLTNMDEPRKLKRSDALEKKLGTDRTDEIIRLHQEIASRLLAAIAGHKRRWTFMVSRAWYVCGVALLEEYQRLKLERGVLDFADLEWKTYRLLNRSRHAEWVQYKLDQRIDHLLVDEFQDTNPTQWRLLLPLLQEIVAGDPERRRSVFLVGDEKQSVYRFRRADPRLFHAARHWLQQHAQAHTLTQHLSRRSSPAIIRFVNLVFHRSSDVEPETDSDYPLQDFQPHDTHHRQLWGRAELLPLVRRGDKTGEKAAPAWRNPLERPRQVDEDQRHRQEGDLIAGKIREILGRLIAEGERVRSLTGDDIMILLRDRTHARFYEEALRRAGIPYIGTGRGAFMQSLEVRDLVHLLHQLVEPYNDLALASALRSPLFAATEDDLLRLAQSPPGTWRMRLERLAMGQTPDGALARARQLLPRWSSYVGRVPVHDLLDRIYCEGNVVARYLAAAVPHLRPRVEANLNHFLELALEVDSGRYPSLSHFLAWLERQAEHDDKSPAEPAWNRAPRVRVMTIHAAKGLESPVVFLADAARSTDNRDRGLRPLVDWPVQDSRPRYFHLGGASKEIDDISQALRTEQQWPARREEANLLYVALTRARQMLYVSGCEPGHGGRGWYGFVEKRLRHAGDSGEAARAGLQLDNISLDDGKTVFNTCAWLEFGQPPSTQPMEPPISMTGFRVDPRLTQPFPELPETGILNPSRSAQPEDDYPDEATGFTEARTPQQRRGKVIHRMLERLTNGETHATVEKTIWQEFGEWLEEKDFNQWWREACAVPDQADFREFFDPARYQEARNEIPILYRDGGRDVYGVIDRLVIRQEEIVLIDYKTHARATRDNVARLAEDFREQMRQYGEGARRLWPGKKLRLVLLFTACGEMVELEKI
ncbi:ATP-dependent exonuclease [Sulfuricaulis limicola]|uniref:DNA 3'-5' helicase n=1 Tax=Sulfuricaulis limicola TaxID=1620215 RepID=A0A1B4XGQ5_9GAMM|nr:UvrD-helicase domain-containing protein [Sulfuricaulis limicola]BAV33998.1 ATP-dependent exonuclease [Sulfuricaulis limicola]